MLPWPMLVSLLLLTVCEWLVSISVGLGWAGLGWAGCVSPRMSNQYSYQYVEPPSSDLLIILTAAPHSLDTLVIFGSTAFRRGYCIHIYII